MTETSKQTHNGVSADTVEEKKLLNLRDICLSNAEYFAKDNSENGQRLYISFMAIKDITESLWPKIQHIQENVADFDFDENTQGNGYRSFMSVMNKAIDYTSQMSGRVSAKRDSVLFRKNNMARDIESCSYLLASLDNILSHLETILSWSTQGCLFPNEEHSPEDLLIRFEDINQYCFYGRAMGFQFVESLRNVLQFIALSMAIFSETYYSQGSLLSKATNSLMTTTRYITDPEQRARRIVNISRYADVDFCKSFWFLSESELLNNMPAVVSPSVSVCKVINLPPEPFSVIVDGKEIEVPVPDTYVGRKPIQVRLISADIREGMVGEGKNRNCLPRSRGMIVHCHGGGFVAHTSKSHEGYLRDWAKHLNVPILSIDYSLAPECPFPRALEEITYAYCWALKNHDILGSTGECIVAAGDSAGANLMLSTTLKCISLGISPPTGIFVAYVPTLVNFIPSPARLLCMMDPLLPFGFMMRCLKAYACPDMSKINSLTRTAENNSDTESFEEISESDLMELQAHKSPTSETSDTLTYGSLMSNDGNLEMKNIKDEVTNADIDQSQKYMSELLEKYVLDSDTDTDGTKVPILKQETSSSLSTADTSLQNKLSSFVTTLRGRISRYVVDKISPPPSSRSLEIDSEKSLIDEFKFTVPNDPYLSPYCASDEDLMKFPPARILSAHMDPCLDDCVMFGKRLKSLGRDVKLDILDGLPHGFLNFSLISRDAHDGSMLCVERIRELLNLDGLPKTEQ